MLSTLLRLARCKFSPEVGLFKRLCCGYAYTFDFKSTSNCCGAGKHVRTIPGVVLMGSSWGRGVLRMECTCLRAANRMRTSNQSHRSVSYS